MLHMSAVFVSDTLAGRYCCIAVLACQVLSQIPIQDAYNEYYDFVVDICDIGVESFATRAQTLLVDHLREHYGYGIANWCKTFWTEARGRICLAHSRYAGCNNNMGIEVSWRDIKKLLPGSRPYC
jgi:hypothetical protein